MGAPEIEPMKPPPVTILPTLAFARIGETLFLCYLRRPGPSDVDWAARLERVRHPDFDRLLVSSPVEAGPNSKQQRVAADYWKGSGRPMPRVARLAASPITRAAFTAFSWLLPNLPMRAFAPADLPAALAWLGSSVSPGAASTLLFRLATERPAIEETRLAV